jgi:hypothetical protein
LEFNPKSVNDRHALRLAMATAWGNRKPGVPGVWVEDDYAEVKFCGEVHDEDSTGVYEAKIVKNDNT